MSVFNIRVYALFINESNQVLVTDEFRFGNEMTKFPGGGLIWGEGTIDCVKRECGEELGCDIEVIKHFYTTEVFQAAAFHDNQQLLSIYYQVKNLTPFNAPILSNKIEVEKKEGAQNFRWVAIEKLDIKEFTFPIDKIVAHLLKSK